MKNVKTGLLLVIGIIVGSIIGIKASTLILSSQVIYKDNKTVDVALNDLFDELKKGKDKIAESITNKGVKTTSNNTLEEMANNIDNISSGNSNLRYDEETGYIQVLDTTGNWTNIYETTQLPILAFDGILYNLGIFSDYFGSDYKITAGSGGYCDPTTNSFINIYATWYGESSANSLCVFQKPINVTGYKTLRFTAYSDYKTSGGVGQYYVGYTRTSSANSFTAKSVNVTSTSPATYTLDVSEITGNIYIAGYAYGYSAQNFGTITRYLHITKIELLK